jgi:hypothetical protein
MNMLDLYTDYLICKNKYVTATGLSVLVGSEYTHDKVSRLQHVANSVGEMVLNIRTGYAVVCQTY